MTTELRTWFDKAGPLAQSMAALAALFAITVAALMIWRATRLLRGKKAADTLTVVAAAMASSVAATGMWHFFSRTMHLPVWIQAVLFAFMEISVLASALRARANVARDGNAGADGLAVWVLTCASGLMSASEASSPQEALVRLGAPLVAAWLWERSMVPERRAQRAAKGNAEAAVRWLFSYKRIAVRLGLATALGADLETEDANRRIDRFVRADNRAQRAGFILRKHAGRRRDRAHARLMEQARMQADPRALYAHLGRQAILDVLARLGGDDAVIDRERAREMQHILTDATRPQGAAAAGAAAAAAAAATGAGPGAAAAATAPRQAPPGTPPTAAAPTPGQPAETAPQNPATVDATAPSPASPATSVLAPATYAADVPQPALNGHAAAQPSPLFAEAATQFSARQDELPLTLPTPQPRIDAPVNGFHIPAARQPVSGPAEPATPPLPAAHVNGNAVTQAAPAPATSPAPAAPAAAPAPTPAPAPAAGSRRAQHGRAPIPVEPVRFVAAPLPEPEPEPEPVYAYDDPEPEYDPEPEPGPAAHPVNNGVIDHQLVARITRAIGASTGQLNVLKLANELGISPAHMHDTIEALGGYNAVWTRARQDRDAETTDTDLAYFGA